MTDFERCREALAILEKLAKKAKVLPEDGYIGNMGAIYYQEMEDCLKSSFYPGDKETLLKIQDQTTNADLYDVLTRYFGKK